MTTPDTLTRELLDFPLCGDRLHYVISILAKGPLDSLRKLSIPCTWGITDTSRDTILQADSILYRKSVDSEKGGPRLTGTLNFHPLETVPPSAYCLKFYDADMDSFSLSIDPLKFLWKGIIPRRPRVKLFRFHEKGGSLGGAGGIGVSKFSGSGLVSANTATDYGLALTFGFLYYSPPAIYQISGELYGVDTSANAPSLSAFTALGMRRYPFTRNSAGWSWYGALEFANFKAKSGTAVIDDSRFGLEIGIGYDTDFDRLTYSFHTCQGGYHEMEFLVGLVALQQGKAGLKASFLKGDAIRFATIQAYMENRVDFRTMELHYPRSLPVQALIYAGMIAVWALAY
jgi:hypothetical protein